MAIISTIKVCLKNFPITSAPMIMSLMLSYWYICPHIESSIRWSFFFGVDTKVYMFGVGITSSIIYAAGAVIMNVEDEHKQQIGTNAYHLAVLDKVGLSMFVIYEIFMVLLLLLFKLLSKEVTVATWICVVLLLGNFAIPIINAECVLNRASDLLRGFTPDSEELHQLQKGKDKNLFASFRALKILVLLVAMMLLVGAGAEIYERLTKISIAISMGYLAEYAMIWFIFGNFVTRCLVGMLYTIFSEINEFSYILFSSEVLIACAMIIFMPTHSVIVFNSACFIAGSGVGGLCVIIPLVIAQDFGTKHFGLLWGAFSFAMELGVWIFSFLIFDHFYENTWGRCTKTK